MRNAELEEQDQGFAEPPDGPEDVCEETNVGSDIVEEHDQECPESPGGPEDVCEETIVGRDIVGDCFQEAAVPDADHNGSVRGYSENGQDEGRDLDSVVPVPGGGAACHAPLDGACVGEGDYHEEDECGSEVSMDRREENECGSEASTKREECSAETTEDEISDIGVSKGSIIAALPVIDGTIPGILSWNIGHFKENPETKRISTTREIAIGDRVQNMQTSYHPHFKASISTLALYYTLLMAQLQR